jgi:hypothetical protein
MKKFITNLFLALPLLFAVTVATPTTAEAQVIFVPVRPVFVAPRYEYRLVYVYGTYWANYGGYLVLVTGGHYEYRLVLVY